METKIIEALSVAFSKSIEKPRPCMFQIVDKKYYDGFFHCNVAINGEHTECPPYWVERVVKHPMLSLKRLTVIEEALKIMTIDDHKVINVSIIYFDDRRAFGMSVLLEKIKA